MWGGDEDRLYAVRSTRKSGAVRFSPTLCQSCNGNRSQPFDRAYDDYSEFLWHHSDEMWNWEGIPMESVFGDRWPEKQLNLGRYFAKHFGCRITEEGLPVPAGLLTFMDGANTAPYVRMCFSKRQDIWELHQGLRGNGSKIAGLWLGAMDAQLNSDRTRVVGVETEASVGYIGVELRWDDDQVDMDSFFPHPFPILNEIPADPKLVEMIRSRRRVLESEQASLQP